MNTSTLWLSNTYPIKHRSPFTSTLLGDFQTMSHQHKHNNVKTQTPPSISLQPAYLHTAHGSQPFRRTALTSYLDSSFLHLHFLDPCPARQLDSRAKPTSLNVCFQNNSITSIKFDGNKKWQHLKAHDKGNEGWEAETRLLNCAGHQMMDTGANMWSDCNPFWE